MYAREGGGSRGGSCVNAVARKSGSDIRGGRAKPKPDTLRMVDSGTKGAIPGCAWLMRRVTDGAIAIYDISQVMRGITDGAFQVYHFSNNGIPFAGPMGQVGQEWQVGGFIALPPAGASNAATQQLA